MAEMGANKQMDTMLAPTKLLTEPQRRQYSDDGIVFPIGVLSNGEIRRFRTACDELENRLGGKPRTVDVRQMHLHFTWAYELAAHPRVLDAVEDILGPDLLIWATELFAKHPSDASISIGWHQDRPYMGFESGETTSAWIALADSVRANGCMRAIPGPGRREISRTAPDGDIVRSQPKNRAATLKVNEEEAVDIVLRAGEMSLHDVDIVHGSGPNQSQEKRIGFVVRFVTPQARPLEGRPAAILVRGRDNAGHFCLVDPPCETAGEKAVLGMRESAALHLETMLHNLKSLKS
jgi:Phytanoyl-CoA dioxygenase (PhyH)